MEYNIGDRVYFEFEAHYGFGTIKGQDLSYDIKPYILENVQFSKAPKDSFLAQMFSVYAPPESIIRKACE